MKTLINNLVAILEAAVTGGSIVKPVGIEAIDVYKGLKDDPTTTLALQHFYIALDDGGERVEDISTNAQKRFYSVMLEMGVYAPDAELSLDYILDLSNNIKTVLELQSSKQKDGHIFGVSITPMAISYDDHYFRGRQITIDFFEVEDRIFEY